MAAGHNDPKILYSINDISAYHIQNGEESPLNSSGPQTLSLLMVPTSSPFADLSTTDPQSAAPEEDFYLHLHLPPELDLSLPATIQIYHQPPRSYVIPRWDLGPDSGAFTRIEFPKIGTGPGRVTQEDVDTFETILAQCTAFLERAGPPSGKGQPSYNPGNFAPGEGYIGHGVAGSKPGQIVLVDEENGSVVGELSDGFNVIEGKDVKAGSKSMLYQLPKTAYTDLPQTLLKLNCHRKEKATRSILGMLQKSISKCPDIRLIRTRRWCRMLQLPLALSSPHRGTCRTQ